MRLTKTSTGEEVLKNASTPQIRSYLLGLVATNKMQLDVLDDYTVHYGREKYNARNWYLSVDDL